MSSSALSLFVFVLIGASYVESTSSFHQTFCFASDLQAGSDSNLIALAAAVSNAYKTIMNSTSPIPTSCNSISDIPDINLVVHDCFECAIDIPGTETEVSHYNALLSLNNHIDLIIAQIPLTPLAYVTNVFPDAASPVVDDHCSNMPYPRICRFDLAAVSKFGAAQFGAAFLLTFVMDKEAQSLTYEISYGETDNPNNWFGIGFGEIGMSGDAAIYTCGELSCSNPVIHDYYLEIIDGERGASGVKMDTELPHGSEDLTDFTKLFVDGEFRVSFNRAFNTGDPWDFRFYGTEESVNVFGAAGIGDGPIMAFHGVSTVVPSVSIPLVPHPEDIIDQICGSWEVGDCIIALDPVIPTKAPSDDPSISPSRQPTDNPTNAPSDDPTNATPTGSPVEMRITRHPTTAHASANQYGLSIMVFMTALCLFYTV
eukprot:160636_1